MSLVRVGTNSRYADGWGLAFSKVSGGRKSRSSQAGKKVKDGCEEIGQERCSETCQEGSEATLIRVTATATKRGYGAG